MSRNREPNSATWARAAPLPDRTLMAAFLASAKRVPARMLKELSTTNSISLLLDMAGPYADVGGQGTVAAVRMAVDDFGGRVLGRPIEVVVADHQNKVDLAGSVTRQWFDEQGVETILDVAGSSAALAVNEIAKQRNSLPRKRRNQIEQPAKIRASGSAGNNLHPSTIRRAQRFPLIALCQGTASAVP